MSKQLPNQISPWLSDMQGCHIKPFKSIIYSFQVNRELESIINYFQINRNAETLRTAWGRWLGTQRLFDGWGVRWRRKPGLRYGTPDDDSDDIEGFAVSERSMMTDERSGVEGPVGGASWRWTWGTKHRLVTDAWSFEGNRRRRSDGNAQLHCAPKVALNASLRHNSGTPGRRSRGSPFLGYRLEPDRGRNDAGRISSRIKRHALLERDGGSSILNKSVKIEHWADKPPAAPVLCL